MNTWPKQSQVREFFGKPGGPQCTAGLVELPFPMRVAWDTKSIVKRFRCHDKVEKPLERIFDRTLARYGLKEIQRLGLDLFGGCYNFRKMRGGDSWSMHSWGIAVDLDPERNALKMSHKTAQFAKPEYAPFWNVVEEEGFLSLGRARDYDWMHFQAAKL